MALNVSFLQELLNTVAEQGRALLPKSIFGDQTEEDVEELARALISGRGEASGVAIARQLLNGYARLPPEARIRFFAFLATQMQPDSERVRVAAAAYLEAPGEPALTKLQAAVESPRQEFFRRLNLAPGATAEIVSMRRDLRAELASGPAFDSVDADMRHLLQSWFNRGFLVLRRIDWQTPAVILEKIMRYEAVHEIKDWDDLRRRLDPADRRCFAFFHPSLIDEPLIFVEIALMTEMPGDIGSLIAKDRAGLPAEEPTTAVFYSISNTQQGLKGISFGNFLLKQVVEELAREKPSLKTFVTLSPVPYFARWLDRQAATDAAGPITADDRAALELLKDPRWPRGHRDDEKLKQTIMELAASYFISARSTDKKPVDPVARFHLGNGARLERLNWLGDTSEKGLREAHGLMVNYRYDLKEIERNHEAFANEGQVTASRAVKSLLRPESKGKVAVTDAVKLLALPAGRSSKRDAKGEK